MEAALYQNLLGNTRKNQEITRCQGNRWTDWDLNPNGQQEHFSAHHVTDTLPFFLAPHDACHNGLWALSSCSPIRPVQNPHNPRFRCVRTVAISACDAIMVHYFDYICQFFVSEIRQSFKGMLLDQHPCFTMRYQLKMLNPNFCEQWIDKNVRGTG